MEKNQCTPVNRIKLTHNYLNSWDNSCWDQSSIQYKNLQQIKTTSWVWSPTWQKREKNPLSKSHTVISSKRLKVTPTHLKIYNYLFQDVHCHQRVHSGTDFQRKSRKNAEHRSERRLEVWVSLKRHCSGMGGAAEYSRAWAAQGHWDYTVARIKIWTKSGRKVVFREGVDRKAVVCYIKKGDSASLIV